MDGRRHLARAAARLARLFPNGPGLLLLVSVEGSRRRRPRWTCNPRPELERLCHAVYQAGGRGCQLLYVRVFTGRSERGVEQVESCKLHGVTVQCYEMRCSQCDGFRFAEPADTQMLEVIRFVDCGHSRSLAGFSGQRGGTYKQAWHDG